MIKKNPEFKKELTKSRSLLEKIELKKKKMLKNLQKKVLRNTKSISVPKKSTKYDNLDNKKLKETLKQKLALKMKTQKKAKDSKLIENCTFEPKINKNTKKLLKNNRLPIHERYLPKKNFDFHGEKKNFLELQEFQKDRKKIDLKKIKPLDEIYYKNQIDWKKNINKKLEFERKQINEEIDFKMKTGTFESESHLAFTKKINDKVKSKKPEDFLTRVDFDLEVKNLNKKKLVKKYNGFSFKPVINDWEHVKSVVKRKYIK